MRWIASLALVIAVSGTACAQEKSKNKSEVIKTAQLPNALETPGRVTKSPLKAKPKEGDRQADQLDTSMLSGSSLEKSLNSRKPINYISCHGIPEQGGAVLCQTNPKAKVKISRGGKDFYYENADDNGQIIVGFYRDEYRAQIAGGYKTVEYYFTGRDYDTSRIDGLPPSQVSTFTEAQLKRIRLHSLRGNSNVSVAHRRVRKLDSVHARKRWVSRMVLTCLSKRSS